eukprot:COSAG06_NODE_32300_length_508_cov_1.266504_2_plen_42_part_01
MAMATVAHHVNTSVSIGSFQHRALVKLILESTRAHRLTSFPG